VPGEVDRASASSLGDRHGGALAPVVDPAIRLLMLGSLPGTASLAAARYYAHPRNQFWRLMATVVGRPLPEMGYEHRLAALLEAGIGLWDVIGSAQRRGSLDAAIRSPVANDLPALVSELPHLRAIGFNGGKAASLGRRIVTGPNPPEMICLPSSSAALTVSIETKQAAWARLRDFL